MGVVIWGRKEKEAEMKEAEMKEVEMKKGGTREIGGKGGARTAVETVERVVVDAEDDFVRPHKIFSTKTKIKIPDDDLDIMSHDNVFKKSRTSWMDTMTTDNFITYRNSASPKRRHLEEKDEYRAYGSPKKKIMAEKILAELEGDSDVVEGMHNAKEVEALKMNKMFIMAGDTFAEDVGIHKVNGEEAVQEVIQETVVETVRVVEEAKPSKKETVVETVQVVEEVVEEAKPSKKEKKKKEAESAEPEEE